MGYYTGRHHTGSLYNTGSTHRWRNHNDRNKNTMCAKGGAAYAVTYKGTKFYKVQVSGIMNAANIRRACQKNKMRPVCDHNAYRDSYCYNSGRNLHFSYPTHDRQLGVNPAIMRGIFFYTGRHHLGSLLNTGSSHRWRNNNDRNQLTMCAKGGAGWCRRGDGSGGSERRVKSGVSSQSACNSYVKRTQRS